MVIIFLLIDLSNELKNVIKSMMHPKPEQRPNVDTLLAMPQIMKILQIRRLMKPFNKIVNIPKTRIKHPYQVNIFSISSRKNIHETC